MSVKKLFGAALVVYANLTTMEWLIHKYVMHGYDRPNFPLVGRLVESQSRKHWAHHHEVNSDMSLEINNKELKHEGHFFQFDSTIIFTVVLFVLLLGQFRVLALEVKPATTAIVSVASTLFYSFLWNNFHALLHGADDVYLPAKNGVPNTYQTSVVHFFPKFWLDWMMLNHAQHHAVKGVSKGNFNRILPGFDYLVGTHTTGSCFDNTARVPALALVTSPKGASPWKAPSSESSFHNTPREIVRDMRSPF